MKRLIFIAVTTVAVVVAFQAASANMRAFSMPDRDWEHDMALMSNDLPKLLKYQPVDGASYSGKVRKTMDPATVRP